LGRNDSLDFCHAAIGSAYAHVLALDRPWQTRVGLLPMPDVRPRCFCRNQLGELVDYLEALVASGPPW